MITLTETTTAEEVMMDGEGMIIEIGREIEIAERMIIFMIGIETTAGVVIGRDTMIEGREIAVLQITTTTAITTLLAGILIITETK